MSSSPLSGCRIPPQSDRVLRTDYAEFCLGCQAPAPGTIISLADIVRGFLPEARIPFEHDTGGKERSGNYLVDKRCFSSRIAMLVLRS
jgi:hypothetical protein